MNIDLKKISITSAREALLKGEYTSVDLVNAYLKNIEEKNKDLNVFLGVFDDVLEQAKAADEIYKNDKAKAESMTLLGIPFATKDNIMIKGKPAQAGSKILAGYVSPYDSTAITKLKNAGAIFLGRLNMDEFAMGGSTENSAFGVTKNPYDTSKVAGGSSGGSAAAIASDMALITLGTDTGGSVRQPAAFCGVVGLKPTYGAISRHGIMAMGSSLDIVGTLSKKVEDSEIVYNVIKGIDSYDMTSVEGDNSSKINNLKSIGIVKGLLDQGGIDESVKSNYLASIELLKSNGYEIVEVDLPSIKYALAVYYVIMPAEVSSNLARFDGVKYGFKKEGNTLLDDYLLTRREGFGNEVRRRIMLGTYVLSAGYHDAYYNKALLVRDMMKKDFAEAFKQVSCILTPTTPTPAFTIGEKSDDPVQMYLADIFTVTANLIGSPSISVPSGFNNAANPLPLGLQFTAPHLCESLLFQVGKDFEKMVNQK